MTVLSPWSAQDLQSPVGQHLVDVHVEGCTCPGLEHIHREMMI